jgi:hypothetical protein
LVSNNCCVDSFMYSFCSLYNLFYSVMLP